MFVKMPELPVLKETSIYCAIKTSTDYSHLSTIATFITIISLNIRTTYYYFHLLLWTSSLTFIPYVTGVTNSIDQGEVQTVISNLYLVGAGSKTTTLQPVDFGKCITQCNFDPKCLSVSYYQLNGTCHLNGVSLTKGKIEARYDTDYKYFQIKKHNSWQLVFRAVAGNGLSVLDAWNNVGHYDDVTSVTANELGCMAIDYRLPCSKHYRSKQLDEFKDVNKVRFAFYTISKVDFKVDFKSTKSTNATEAFDMANLIENPDEPSGFVGPYNHESVEGYSPCHRRFYISQSHSPDCNEDVGWMFVSDGPGEPQCCGFESSGSYPQFLYSKYGDPVNWNNATAAKTSEVFAVFFKYKTPT